MLFFSFTQRLSDIAAAFFFELDAIIDHLFILNLKPFDVSFYSATSYQNRNLTKQTLYFLA